MGQRPVFGTPLYYRPHLDRFPERNVRVLLLALAGVAPADIATDCTLSAERLCPAYAARGEPNQEPVIAAFLAEAGTSAGKIAVDILADLDVQSYVREHGLDEADLHDLRARLLGARAAR